MLTQATQHLITTAHNASSSEAELRAAAQDLLSAAGRAPAGEVNATLAAVAEHFALDDLPRAALLALVGGALVERGADPRR